MKLQQFLLTVFVGGLALSVHAQESHPAPSPTPEKPATTAQAVTKTDAETPAALNFTMTSIDGDNVELSKYVGKVVVIVNTASECGMTPQYKQLQALHKKFGDKGVAVLGFPCNQFGEQEPGSEADIKSFCQTNYDVTFDMFSKVDVNGENASPLFKFLTAQELSPKNAGVVGWNFEKFVLDKTGKPVARFGSRVKPDSDAFMAVIEEELEK